MAILDTDDDENGATPGLSTQGTGAVGSTSPTAQGGTGGASAVSTNSVQQNQGSQPLTTAGASGLVSGGATGVGGQPNTTPAGNTAGSSGLFTNLGSYLSGNQDNTNTLGSNLSNFYTNQSQAALSTLGTNVDQYGNLIQAGTITADPNVLSAEAANPTTFAQNANNVGTYQNYLNGTYSGPTSFESSQQYANAEQPIQQYDAYVSDLNSPTTYGNVLQSLYQGQPFSQGQENLDASLLQNTPSTLQGVEKTISGIGSLDQDLSNAAQTEDAASQQGAATTANTAATAKNQLTGQETGLQNTINADTQAAQQAATAQNAGLVSALTNYNTNTGLTPQQLSALGLTQDQWNQLSGNIANYNNQYGSKYGDLTNLSGYVSNTGLGNINPNTVATTDQYNEQNALNTIAGAALPADDFISTPQQAASAPTSIDSFNYNQALQDVQASMQSAQNAGANGKVSQPAADSKSGGLLQTIATVAVIAAVAAC